jgi:hypothetical protein
MSSNELDGYHFAGKMKRVICAIIDVLPELKLSTTIFCTLKSKNKKRYRGIEPLASVWKTEVLPLYEYRNN